MTFSHLICDFRSRPVISPTVDFRVHKGLIPKCLYHFNFLLLVFKLALLTSFLSSKLKRIFYLESGKKVSHEPSLVALAATSLL